MSPIIHHRRTVSANAVDRIRQRISEVKRSTEVSDMTKPLRELIKAKDEDYMHHMLALDGPHYEKQSEVLQEWFDGTEIAALEWVLREIFEAVP